MHYPPGYIAWLCGIDYNYLNADDSFYEEWLLDDDETMLRLASIPESSNCLFIIDRDLI